MTRTHEVVSEELRRLGIRHRNEVHFRAPDWEYGYTVDIYLPDQQEIIEVDGPSHIGRESRDRIRDGRFKRDLGLRTIRIKHGGSESEPNLRRTLRKAISGTIRFGR